MSVILIFSSNSWLFVKSTLLESDTKVKGDISNMRNVINSVSKRNRRPNLKSIPVPFTDNFHKQPFSDIDLILIKKSRSGNGLQIVQPLYLPFLIKHSRSD